MVWTSFIPLAVVAMFLFPSGEQPENPWKSKAPDIISKAERSATPEAYLRGLDAAYRADDWQAGLRLAHAALRAHPENPALRGLMARALWRAGKADEAEQVVDRIDPVKSDRETLAVLIEINLARGEYGVARAAADRLEKLGPRSAMQYYHVLNIRMLDNQIAGLAAELRKAARLVDPANGYPEAFIAEALDGLPEFFEAIGPEPINVVAASGEAEMPMVSLLRLPYCVATINGKGPYRLIVDTGGSISLSLDDDVAREIGLKPLGTAAVRGVSGKQESQQSLVDELRIGNIVCKRVMTRSFEMQDVLTVVTDGIIGTGVFAQARMTMDFEHARLRVEPSSHDAAPGNPVKLLIIGDAKLVAPIQLHGKPALALLDSGADVAAVSPIVLRELFPNRKMTNFSAAGVGVGQGEAAGISLAPGVNLDLWGRQFENYSGIGLDALDSLLSPILGMQTQVLLGMPVFREMKSCTVDFPKRKMWVNWLE